MADVPEFVDLEVELNKADVEILDQDAARIGCTRNDLLSWAVALYLDKKKELVEEEASRTGHGAKEPPTAD
jgi:hypothetical protein